jgi:metal-responsive CopG/Arc/MetJ family transcriptional regulator
MSDMTTRITVRLDERLRSELDRYGKATGKSPSDAVREALSEYLGKRTPSETLADRLRRSGFLGCVKGGPRDLSTNKDYMEGFGE